MSKRKIRNLKRKPPNRAPRRRFEVYCEGKVTEVDYILSLKRRYIFGAIIELKLYPAVGVPLTIAKNAVAAFRKDNRRSAKSLRDSFDENDEFWAVFDRDDHPGYEEATKRCLAAGVKVARSNPCFEVWVILHFENYDRPDDRRRVCHRVSELCPGYDPEKNKRVDCDDLVLRVDAAEKRAADQLRRREEEGSPIGPPYTTFGSLTLSIREAAQAHQPRVSRSCD